MTDDTSPKATADSVVSTTAGRQRKKRKWDQPAEPLVAAGLVASRVPFTSNAILGSTLPGSFPSSASLSTNQIPMSSVNPLEMVQLPLVTQNAATIIQKLNQPKIQDEVIAREIVINDAEPTIRYKLTKRQTQEEIQKCTGAVVITRGKYRPPNGFPDYEKPLYLHISAGANIKDIADRIRAVDHAASMVEEIMQKGQIPLVSSTLHSNFINGEITQNLTTCLFLGFEADPSLNIAARIRGPNDLYINHIMNETGATVVLRGQASEHLDSSRVEEALQPLHLYLSSSNKKSLEAAKILAENLLDTIARECGTSRISSTKVYGAVPPPQQLLVGTESSSKIISAGNSNQAPVFPSTTTGNVAVTQSFVPSGVASISGSVFQSVEQLKYGNPQSSVSYALPGVSSVTCYNGYEGIYPQTTPLQQVALALRQASSSSASVPSMNSLASTTERKPSSAPDADTQPLQKRKFKELSVSSKVSTPLQNSQQGSEFLKPGLEDSDAKPLSSMLPPRTMPPPPPKFSSSNSLPKIDNSKTCLVDPSALQRASTNMPPPPPRFSKSHLPTGADSVCVDTRKPTVHHLSDTLLKLAEYGDDEEEILDRSVELPKSSPFGNSSVKPFWAV
ncbi:protein RIK-like isoform X1 [Zingiber officinale]|uniref:protein RIK-like isoform X1 n=1 Tax=Zingiber officinale TaxID=94328 RepID=UPI001C4D556B|nr:protein RIK-like isoform X1 [Zingiber officinale]